MESNTKKHLISAVTTFVVAFVIAFTANVGDLNAVASAETATVLAAISTAARAGLKALISYIPTLFQK